MTCDSDRVSRYASTGRHHPYDAVGVPMIPLCGTMGATSGGDPMLAMVALPDSLPVHREVRAMLENAAQAPPAPPSWLRLWLHRRAVWLEAALRPAPLEVQPRTARTGSAS